MREANSLAGMAAVSADVQEVRRQWLTVLDKLERMKNNAVHGKTRIDG